jgi:hypothetical protein
MNELLNDALVTSEVTLVLRNGTKPSVARFVRCYREIFRGGGKYGKPREKSVGFVS